ncbi:hypothetical protein BASA81_005912 [Batrachochytrium salamandrivorans]|nr:hypothetical protein BASA81_005912 [Batrachochytrium salamandrivorans]
MDSTIGFSREEMYKDELAGKSQPPLVRHLFVVASTRAESWAADYEDEPVKTLASKLDKKKFRVTAVEQVSGDQVGDILIFPDFCRVRPDLSTPEQVEEFIQRVSSPVPMLVGEDSHPLFVPQVFVCAHTSRDARCGYCGPALCDKFNSLGDVEVRKCAHIGGHVYAGNVIVYHTPGDEGEQSAGDWFGYIKPEDVDAIHAWLIKPQGYPPHNIHHLWRGRGGVKDTEHVELSAKVCAACSTCTAGVADMEDGVEGRPSLCIDKPLPVARVLFILGAPGSGKGTQCANLVRDYDLVHLSAGDLLREERQNPNSSDGQLIETYITEGKIVPVAITVKLLWIAMQQHMKQGRCNFLIDGFPRNQDNLNGWNEQLPSSKARVVGVLFLDCAESIVRARLLERGKTSGRSDDNLESILKRFKTFVGETMPIVQYFAARNQCWSLDSSRTITQVYEDVRRVVDDFVLPQHQHVVVVCTSPSTISRDLELQVCQKLLEEFDCVWVDSLAKLGADIKARNVIVKSSAETKAYTGKFAAVLSLGADKREVSSYQSCPVVLEVEMNKGDAYLRTKQLLQPVFLPAVFQPAATVAAPEVQSAPATKQLASVAVVKGGDNVTKVLLAVTVLTAITAISVWAFRSRAD